MLGNFVSGSNSASVTLLQVGRSPRRIEMMNCQSAFLESYRPPLDGERYLTDGEVSGGKVLYPETGLREVLEANYRKPLE